MVVQRKSAPTKYTRYYGMLVLEGAEEPNNICTCREKIACDRTFVLVEVPGLSLAAVPPEVKWVLPAVVVFPLLWEEEWAEQLAPQVVVGWVHS